METFSALLALCAGNSPVPVNSPHKGQWRGALMLSLIYAWINDWVNSREAGDLRRQRGHYDVSVMVVSSVSSHCLKQWRFNGNIFDDYASWIFNSLAPWRFEQNFRLVIFKLISVSDGWGISCKIVLRWKPLDLTDDKSTLVQVMAWCRQATSHYLSQRWPRFMSSYGVTRPQWVNMISVAMALMT